MRSCKNSSGTPSTAAFATLLTERVDLKNHCEAFTMETQCIPVLAAETKKLREKLADRKKTNTTMTATSKSLEKKHATSDSKRTVVLEVVLAEAKAVHARLVDIFTQSAADATNTQADLESTKVCLGVFGQQAKLTNATLYEA